MTLDELNYLRQAQAIQELLPVCGSRRWCERMEKARPFHSLQSLQLAADRFWTEMGPEDWLEAFGHHPRIGDLDSLRAKFATASDWANQEQAGAEHASEEIVRALADGNAAYEARFGHIFLVCATGKTAEEMLGLLRERMANEPDVEKKIAAAEQGKITRIRLEKWLTP